jgi:hypothetical protein
LVHGHLLPQRMGDHQLAEGPTGAKGVYSRKGQREATLFLTGDAAISCVSTASVRATLAMTWAGNAVPLRRDGGRSPRRAARARLAFERVHRMALSEESRWCDPKTAQERPARVTEDAQRWTESKAKERKR